MPNHDAPDAPAHGEPSEPLIPPSEPLAPGPPEPASPPAEPIVPAGPALAEDVAEQLATAQASMAELSEAMQHAEAEVENIRRRILDDISRAHKYAIEDFAAAVLPVKDSLETALQIQTPSVEAMQQGVALTLKQLDAAFARNRLVEIDPAPGERLDSVRHRAISMVPAPQSANTIVSVLQKGYQIGDRVLRPALVTVAQEKSAEE
jgi:molecular chaperone GrpE